MSEQKETGATIDHLITRVSKVNHEVQVTPEIERKSRLRTLGLSIKFSLYDNALNTISVSMKLE